MASQTLFTAQRFNARQQPYASNPLQMPAGTTDVWVYFEVLPDGIRTVTDPASGEQYEEAYLNSRVTLTIRRSQDATTWITVASYVFDQNSGPGSRRTWIGQSPAFVDGQLRVEQARAECSARIDTAP